jgi:hypothetical protein
MLKRRKKPFNLESQQTCKTFFNITDIPYIGNEKFARVVSLWNISGFTNREKSFIFKFYNNILGINTRTSHFAANPTRACFFAQKGLRQRIRMKVFCIYFIPVRQAGIGTTSLLGFSCRHLVTLTKENPKNSGFWVSLKTK